MNKPLNAKVTSKDQIGLLLSSPYKGGMPANLSTYRSVSPGSSTGSSCRASRAKDTVHYLSPATTPAGTELEGDLYYQQFVEFRQPVGQSHDDYASSTESTISCRDLELQRTLTIIKPNAIQYKDVVVRAIKEAGIQILNSREIHLTPEQVSEIYAKYYGSPSFPHVVISMSVSPMVILSLAGRNVVDKWKTMVGPYGLLREEWFYAYSVRTRFGPVPDIPDVIHASENLGEAKWENRYFFPRSILEPLVIDEEKVADYVNNCITPMLMEGLAQVVKNKPIDPVLYLAEWLLLNNPYQPKFPDRVAVSPL